MLERPITHARRVEGLTNSLHSQLEVCRGCSRLVNIDHCSVFGFDDLIVPELNDSTVVCDSECGREEV